MTSGMSDTDGNLLKTFLKKLREQQNLLLASLPPYYTHTPDIIQIYDPTVPLLHHYLSGPAGLPGAN